MNAVEAALFAAELRRDLPELDLHGCFTYEVQEKLEIFLYQQIERQEQAFQIIYGFGTGALRRVVLEYLQSQSLIAGVKEYGGKCLVVLFS